MTAEGVHFKVAGALYCSKLLDRTLGADNSNNTEFVWPLGSSHRTCTPTRTPREKQQGSSCISAAAITEQQVPTDFISFEPDVR